MANNKLGFTFYPRDWWTSDSFFELNSHQRYIYLECLFSMYANDGYLKTQKTQFENRTRIEISDNDWGVITSKFIKDQNGFTHPSVNRRLGKTLANRENGKKGGRPKKLEEKPKKPNLETQNNPPSEREREREYKENINIEENISGNEVEEKIIDEKGFIEIWKRARLHYDNKQTGFDSLLPFEKQCFTKLVPEFGYVKFEKAVAGMFFQDTLPAVRVRPDHFLKRENFEKYLDCWINQSKMFDNSKSDGYNKKAQPSENVDHLKRKVYK